VRCRQPGQGVTKKSWCKSFLVSQALPPIALGERQWTRRKARRNRYLSGLVAARMYIQKFGHCSFPRPPPQCRGFKARQYIVQTVTLGCPNWGTEEQIEAYERL